MSSTAQPLYLEHDAADYVDKVADSMRARLVQDASVVAHRRHRPSAVIAQKDIKAGISLRRQWARKRIRVLLARRLLTLIGIVGLIITTFAIGAISLTYFEGEASTFVGLALALSLLLTAIFYSFIKTYFDGGAVVSADPPQFLPRSSKEERKLELVVQWDTLERRIRDEVESSQDPAAVRPDLGPALLYFADTHGHEADDLRKALRARNSVVHARWGLTIEQLNDALNYINSVLQQLPPTAHTTLAALPHR